MVATCELGFPFRTAESTNRTRPVRRTDRLRSSKRLISSQSTQQKHHATKTRRTDATRTVRGVATHATGTAGRVLLSGIRPAIVASGIPGTSRTSAPGGPRLGHVVLAYELGAVGLCLTMWARGQPVEDGRSRRRDVSCKRPGRRFRATTWSSSRLDVDRPGQECPKPPNDESSQGFGRVHTLTCFGKESIFRYAQTWRFWSWSRSSFRARCSRLRTVPALRGASKLKPAVGRAVVRLTSRQSRVHPPSQRQPQPEAWPAV